MAKLTVILALLVALIAVTSATAYTTVVTITTEEDVENPNCQKEIKQLQMGRCMEWMRTRGMGGPYEGYSFLRSAVANPTYQEEPQVKECCTSLRSVSSPCRCKALRQMMMRIQHQYGMEEGMQQMLRQKAESLPRMCNWRSPTECHFRAVFV